jgi:inositol-phosphate phosphatase/L-galactose 1-phosphate phosphatase/histidinol-phosphatase
MSPWESAILSRCDPKKLAPRPLQVNKYVESLWTNVECGKFFVDFCWTARLGSPLQDKLQREICPSTMPRAAAHRNACEIFTFAEKLADMARDLARAHFRTTTAYERKADLSPVTVADRAIEAALRSAIEECYPGHGILGEEMGHQDRGRELWVLDPIDGTKAFVTGMPLFGTLIAYLEEDVPRLGIIEMPALGERWSAALGVTAFGGSACQTSKCASLAEARIYTSSPDVFSPDDWARYERLSRETALRRFGGDCYMYGLLASGFCEIVVEESLMPYDYMALVAVIEGAGGVISDWEGRPLTLRSDGRVVASANRALHEKALKLLAE